MMATRVTASEAVGMEVARADEGGLRGLIIGK